MQIVGAFHTPWAQSIFIENECLSVCLFMWSMRSETIHTMDDALEKYFTHTRDGLGEILFLEKSEK